MAKKRICIALALTLVLSLSACGGNESGVSVQRADQLAAAGMAQERYAGMVVSDNVVEIPRDSTKTIEELYVEVGQEVKAGDKLFSYDSDALELDLEKAQLEVEKMTNEQTTYAEQVAALEKQLARTYNQSEIVRLTLEVNTLKTAQMENDYNLAAKEQEIADLQEMLANVDITTPVDGTVRSITEQSENNVYITVQQSGAYRVKGMINEMSMGNGLMIGSRVKIYSRVSDETWMGTVDNIDTEDATQNTSDMYYYGYSDTMTTTTSYPFYVVLDNVDGLLLGQHVYMEVISEEPDMPGLWIPEMYLTDITMDEETFEMRASVWADNGKGKLEQRTVSLGMFDYMTGCYEVLDGLTAEDYVADPAAPGCESGASVSYRNAEDFDTPVVTEGAEDEAADETLDFDESIDENIDISVEETAGEEIADQTGVMEG